jgi:hypothetical protein
VRDLLDKVAKFSGAVAEFPGDTTYDTLTTGSGPYLLDTKDHVEGLDIRFTSGSIGNSEWIDVFAKVVPTNFNNIVGFRIENDLISMVFRHPTTNVYMYAYSLLNISLTDKKINGRVIYHDQFVTLEINDRWIYTYTMDEPTYYSPLGIYLASQSGREFTNVNVAELSDSREAVYIDLETDGKAAMSSIIQERPVEIGWRSQGQISFRYGGTRDSVTMVIEPRAHARSQTLPRDSASDAIVYYSDVKGMQNPDFSERYGFSTKVYRFPSLMAGALKAVRIVFHNLLERAVMHRLKMRPDLRIEVGDELNYDYIIGGTQTHLQGTVIVESTSIEFSGEDSNPVMEVTGREKID